MDDGWKVRMNICTALWSFVNFCRLSQSEVSTDNRKVSTFFAFQHVRCRCCYRSYLDRFLMNWMLAFMKVRNPRRAGGAGAWSAVADIWLHISALLCWSLRIIAIHGLWYLLVFLASVVRGFVGFYQSYLFLRATVGTLCCLHPRLWLRLLDPQLARLLG